MVRAWHRGVLAALLALASLLAGCSQDFFDLEMHLGREHKTRPLAIVCEPPEAAPGDTVRVELLFYTPDPAACTVSWQVALDFDAGEFATEITEAQVRPLAPPPPVDEGEGFLRQRFDFVVPDSTLLLASVLPDPLEDPSTVDLARALLPLAEDELPPKDLVNAYLASLGPEDLAGQDESTRTTILALADRFACRVRLRARLSCELDVDVTRSLTVRQSRRLASPNTNANPEAESFEILAIPHPDVDWADRELYAAELQHHPFVPGLTLELPRHDDWTYYAVLTPIRQSYGAVTGSGAVLLEGSSFRWYYLDLDAPGSTYALLRNDEGEETEMWDLDASVRLTPPAVAGSTRYRLVACLRDERPGWDYYQFAPGLSVFEAGLAFSAASLP